MPPTPQQLLKQAILLQRGEFDMRCATAMAELLAERHDDHGALAYGLLTGMVAAYCRPFTKSHAYGRLGNKWERFPGMPHLKTHHDRLLNKRHTLLAHNDRTEHRAAIIWTRGAWHDDKAAVVEARSPVNAAGIAEVRELFAYQERRFGHGVHELADELQAMLDWPDAREVDLGLELERLEAGQSVAEFYATPRRAAELPPP
jgi:hypothetical protein